MSFVFVVVIIIIIIINSVTVTDSPLSVRVITTNAMVQRLARMLEIQKVSGTNLSPEALHSLHANAQMTPYNSLQFIIHNCIVVSSYIIYEVK